LVESPRHVLHFVVAAILFRRIGGATPDTFLETLSQKQRGEPLQKQLYNFMMEAAAEDTQTELERCIVAASLSWEPLKANLDTPAYREDTASLSLNTYSTAFLLLPVCGLSTKSSFVTALSAAWTVAMVAGIG
jgi:hypothetical protein